MSTLSKIRDIKCTRCAGTGRATAAITSGACPRCSGHGVVSEHQLAECWCDGTEQAHDHDSH